MISIVFLGLVILSIWTISTLLQKGENERQIKLILKDINLNAFRLFETCFKLFRNLKSLVSLLNSSEKTESIKEISSRNNMKIETKSPSLIDIKQVNVNK